MTSHKTVFPLSEINKNGEKPFHETSAGFEGSSAKGNLRLHVEEVSHGHVGVALAVAVPLCEKLVLGPGHVNPIRDGFGLVVHGGAGGRVSVMDQLGLAETDVASRHNAEGWQTGSPAVKKRESGIRAMRSTKRERKINVQES